MSIHSLETSDPRFSKIRLLDFQKKTWEVFLEIKKQLKEGLTEDEARKLALALFLDHGVTKHWHRPVIRLGPGTCLTPGDPIQDQYRLQENDAVFIDLGSVWHDSESDLSYETDVGDTFVFGTNLEAEKCAETARDLFSQAQTAWKNQALTGEQIYQFLKEKAEKENYHLVEKVNGHRIADFPHHSYSKDRLGRLSFHPSSSLWVLEVQIRHPSLNFGAFFEDIL